MTDIVTNGQTVTVTIPGGFSISSNSTVDAGGLFDGAGAVTGAFVLENDGTISGDKSGSVLSVNTGTLTNVGTIIANVGSVTVQSGVVVTNLSSGTLTGGTWEAFGTGDLSLLSGPIVTDNATITLSGTASVFDGSGSTPIDNTLTAVGGALNLLNGRNFSTSNQLMVGGTVTLGGGTLDPEGGNGLVINSGGRVVGSGTIASNTTIASGGTIEANSGTLTLQQSTFVNGVGTMQDDTGASLALVASGVAHTQTYTQTIINNGTIDAASSGLSGVLDMAGVYSGTGSFLIQGGLAGARTTLELPVGLSANVAFDSNVGELLLDLASTFNGTISGFGNSDTIVMSNLGNALNASRTGNVVNLTNSGGGVVQSITIDTNSMNYNSAVWSVQDISNTATLKVSGVTAAACYAAGTRIKTETGEVAVEDLVPGDIVQAHFAGLAPVVWIGHRHIDCRRHAEPAKVWPVCVSAHAFGPRMPHRDLVLSPDHAVFVDDVLIPIKHLVNGHTIVQRKVDTVTYYHVELAEHDVLLAEGMPAESYLENGDRAVFDNAGGVIALHPVFGAQRWEAYGCAPLVLTGATLDAVAARTRARIPKRRRAQKLFKVA